MSLNCRREEISIRRSRYGDHETSRVGDPAQGGTLIGTGVTTKTLYPAEAQDVLFELPEVPDALKSGTIPLVLIVDDGGEPHTWTECRTDNNKTAIDPVCKAIG